MSSTKKDFEKIAEIFAGEVAMVNHLLDSDIKKSAQVTLHNLILSIADHFAQTNKYFDRDKFYAASGYNSLRSI